MLSKCLAFFRKDLLVETSYKLSFLIDAATVAFSLATYFFIDRMFGQRLTPHLQEFGVGYFPYVLVGMAFFNYIGVGLGSFAQRLRLEQLHGTLEAILATPTTVGTIVVSLVLWNLCWATLELIAYLTAGVVLFHISFTQVNLLSAFVVLLLTILSFGSLGIISASFVMMVKRGNPLNWLINSLQGLLGGVYFPITVMPQWLQWVARCLPITYAIKAMELAVYRGYTVGQLRGEIAMLAVFCAFLMPISLNFFRYSLMQARKEGSLIKY